jgi:hypothetical protein
VKVYILFTTKQFARLFLTHFTYTIGRGFVATGQARKSVRADLAAADGNSIYIATIPSELKEKHRSVVISKHTRPSW